MAANPPRRTMVSNGSILPGMIPTRNRKSHRSSVGFGKDPPRRKHTEDAGMDAQETNHVVDWREHIVCNPEILCGKPTLKGTRLSVEFVLELRSEENTSELQSR